MVVISSVNMEGKLDILGKSTIFQYTGSQKTLVLHGIEVGDMKRVLAALDDGDAAQADAPEPAAPEVVEASAEPEPTPAKKAPKKERKTRKKAAPKKATEKPVEPVGAIEVIVAEPEPSKGRDGAESAPNGASGGASAPIDATAELDAAPEDDSSAEIVVEEVGSAMAAHTESTEEIPEGWERDTLDGRSVLVHTACGSEECLCDITEAARAEDQEDAEAAAAGDPEEPVVDSNADPLVAQLKDTNRLLHVLDAIISTGMRDEEEIFAKCNELKPDVPVLARITPATWDDRIRRAIGVTLPPA